MGYSVLLKKASLVGAFFVSVFLVSPLWAFCPAPGKLPQVRVERVVDGDTLRLADGRSVRLIGLNAPERARDGRPAQAFAEAARKRLQALVATNDGRVGLRQGEPARDHYGRTLAHAYDAAGRNLEAQLLAEGLAYLVAFAPDGGLVGCQQVAERQARSNRLGLWRQDQLVSPQAIKGGGFALVRFWYHIPFDRLEKEVAPHSDWLVYLGLTTPRLAIRDLSAEAIGADLWRVRLVVENRGFLPTSGAQKAVDQQVSRGVFADLALAAGARLIDGEARRALGELEGRIAQRSTATWWGYHPGTPDRAVADWVVAAPAGTKIAVEASHARAGRERRELVLGAPGN